MKVLALALLLLGWSVTIHAQVATQSYLRDNPDDKVQEIIKSAEEHFNLGQRNLIDGKSAAARREFDKAVDTVLESDFDIRSNPRLQRYYLELVELIHRYEAQAASKSETAVGFAEQKFEPSPLDALSKIVLNGTESSVKVSSSCQLRLPQSPMVRGLKLGQQRKDVEAHIEGLHVPRGDKFGVALVAIEKRSLLKDSRRNSLLVNALSVGLQFTDERMSTIWLDYDNSIRWKDADEFRAAIKERLNLPGRWVPMNSYRNAIFCEGFVVVAGIERNPYLVIIDLEAGKVVAARQVEEKRRAFEQRQREAEAKKKAFKP